MTTIQDVLAARRCKHRSNYKKTTRVIDGLTKCCTAEVKTHDEDGELFCACCFASVGEAKPAAPKPAPAKQVSTSSNVDAALAYARLGWAVMPLAPGQKRPAGWLVKHGVKDATTDEATIRAWWGRTPDAGVAIAAGKSGLVIVDIDPRNGGSLEAVAATGLPTETLTAATPAGGWHLFYDMDAEDLPDMPEGVDIKTGHGYVCAFPSIHPNGGQYQWERWMPPLKLELCAA